MARSAVSGRVATSARLAQTRSAASGRYNSLSWKPSNLGSIVAESWLDGSVTMGTTPRSQGTAPPVLIYSGTLTGSAWPYVQIDSTAGGTGLGQATFKVSYDDGATFPYTGILTGASVAMPGIGSAITANWPAGPYNVNNIYQPLCAQVNDTNGTNHATQVTAANCPILRMIAFNGKPSLDYGTGTTFSLATPSLSLGAHTILMILKGTVSSGYAAVHKNDGGTDGQYIFSTVTNSIFIATAGAGTQSARNVNATWIRDSVRKTIAVAFGGTHSTHLAYINGANAGAVDGPVVDSPGVTARIGPLYIGSNATPNTSFQGLIAGWTVVSRMLIPEEIKWWHDYAAARFPL